MSDILYYETISGKLCDQCEHRATVHGMGFDLCDRHNAELEHLLDEDRKSELMLEAQQEADEYRVQPDPAFA